MRCDELAAWFDDLIDGALPAARQLEVEHHLASCARCRREEQALRATVHRARTLPRSVQPGHDLWPEIAAAIRAHGTSVRNPTVGPSRPRWALALAAVVVVVILGGALLIGMRIGRSAATVRVGERRPSAARVAGVGRELERGGREYERARAQLLEILRARQGSLAPGTVAVVEHNIEVIDGAVGAIRSALAASPADPALGQLLLATYRQEIDLLQQVTQLPGRA
ncbi:MAG: anti-sigma factor family protein [Acidobacteriota bacterium]